MRHLFYEKPTMSPTLFHALYAYQWRSRWVIMSEELRRRLIHIDYNHTREEVLMVVIRLLQKIEDNGYKSQLGKR